MKQMMLVIISILIFYDAFSQDKESHLPIIATCNMASHGKVSISALKMQTQSSSDTLKVWVTALKDTTFNIKNEIDSAVTAFAYGKVEIYLKRNQIVWSDPALSEVLADACVRTKIVNNFALKKKK